MPEPSRLAFQHELSGPGLKLLRVLWPGKPIYISPMLRHHHEVVQIAFDQLCFVLSPKRITEGFDQESGFYRAKRQVGK